MIHDSFFNIILFLSESLMIFIQYTLFKTPCVTANANYEESLCLNIEFPVPAFSLHLVLFDTWHGNVFGFVYRHIDSSAVKAAVLADLGF